MRCGIPLVASCTGAIPEILEDAGLLVDPHDAKEVAEAIAQVAASESLRATLIRKGLERAQDFSWPQAARAILAICRQAVDEKESD